MTHSRHGALDGENLPLITKRKPSTWSSTLKRYFNAEIDTRRADVILIICFFVSGLTDSGAYNAWNIFVSMQTGNTIFAALSLSNLPHGTTKFQLQKSLTAISSFLLGAIFFSTIHRLSSSPRKRSILLLSSSIQMILVIASAALLQSGSVSDNSPKKPVHMPPDLLNARMYPGHRTVELGVDVTKHYGWGTRYPWDLLPIVLLSFQAAGKVVASRVLQHAQLPTVVVSVLYTDLVSDSSFFSGGVFGNTLRNRRIGVVVHYFAGAVMGGIFASSRVGFAGAMWVAAVVNGGIVLAWFGWGERRGEEMED